MSDIGQVIKDLRDSQQSRKGAPDQESVARTVAAERGAKEKLKEYLNKTPRTKRPTV